MDRKKYMYVYLFVVFPSKKNKKENSTGKFGKISQKLKIVQQISKKNLKIGRKENMTFFSIGSM
jgi:hypothetical protein